MDDQFLEMSVWIETLTVLCEWVMVYIGTKDKECIEANILREVVEFRD